MSNASLKEQLKALSLDKLSSNASQKKERSSASSMKGKGKSQKPAWLEYIQYGVELLKTHFPACFKDNKDIQPLKIGIKQDLVKHLGSREDIVIGDKACMVRGLSYYVNSTHYYRSVLTGVNRIDLEGNTAGVVSLEEATYSVQRCQEKQQKKTNKAKKDVLQEG